MHRAKFFIEFFDEAAYISQHKFQNFANRHETNATAKHSQRKSCIKKFAAFKDAKRFPNVPSFYHTYKVNRSSVLTTPDIDKKTYNSENMGNYGGEEKSFRFAKASLMFPACEGWLAGKFTKIVPKYKSKSDTNKTLFADVAIRYNIFPANIKQMRQTTQSFSCILAWKQDLMSHQVRPHNP